MSLGEYGGNLSKIQENLLVKHIKKWGDPNFSCILLSEIFPI